MTGRTRRLPPPFLAAVLPVYYSQVAGSTLGSPARATLFWTVTLSLSLVLVGILSPILGTISDIMLGKKKFLAVFVGIGTVGTGLLVFVGSGDWLLASGFFILARLGFASANVFYDSLLPHVARPEDLDRVSTQGFAIGYLGGGVLLAVNIALILGLGANVGTRLSFISLALWWGFFSIPILRRVPIRQQSAGDPVHCCLLRGGYPTIDARRCRRRQACVARC